MQPPAHPWQSRGPPRGTIAVARVAVAADQGGAPYGIDMSGNDRGPDNPAA